MAKKLRIFTKDINGEKVTLTAHTPADEVQFVYDGWREVVPEPAPATDSGDAAPSAAPKKSGKAADR